MYACIMTVEHNMLSKQVMKTWAEGWRPSTSVRSCSRPPTSLWACVLSCSSSGMGGGGQAEEEGLSSGQTGEEGGLCRWHGAGQTNVCGRVSDNGRSRSSTAHGHQQIKTLGVQPLRVQGRGLCSWVGGYPLGLREKWAAWTQLAWQWRLLHELLLLLFFLITHQWTLLSHSCGDKVECKHQLSLLVKGSSVCRKQSNELSIMSRGSVQFPFFVCIYLKCLCEKHTFGSELAVWASATGPTWYRLSFLFWIYRAVIYVGLSDAISARKLKYKCNAVCPLCDKHTAVPLNIVGFGCF